ncbi:MAG: ArsR/SmtB family transcription factor [Candidatus Bathyarchaeales archaeon]
MESERVKRDLSEICSTFFLTLANPTRLSILELLYEGPKNVTAIAKALKQEQSMISHNLRLLERCRFVFSERRKKERYYILNKETIEPLLKIFWYHAKKYCPRKGKCLSQRGLRQHRKRTASASLYLTRQ